MITKIFSLESSYGNNEEVVVQLLLLYTVIAEDRTFAWRVCYLAAYHSILLNSIFITSFFEYRERFRTNPSIMPSYIYLFYYFSKSGESVCASRRLEDGRYFLRNVGYIELAMSCVQSFPDDTTLCKNVLGTIESLLLDSLSPPSPSHRAPPVGPLHRRRRQALHSRAERQPAKPEHRRAGAPRAPRAQLHGPSVFSLLLTDRADDAVDGGRRRGAVRADGDDRVPAGRAHLHARPAHAAVDPGGPQPGPRARHARRGGAAALRGPAAAPRRPARPAVPLRRAHQVLLLPG